MDIICAQGGEGGGHTGDVATSLSAVRAIVSVWEPRCVMKREVGSGLKVEVVFQHPLLGFPMGDKTDSS